MWTWGQSTDRVGEGQLQGISKSNAMQGVTSCLTGRRVYTRQFWMATETNLGDNLENSFRQRG